MLIIAMALTAIVIDVAQHLAERPDPHRPGYRITARRDTRHTVALVLRIVLYIGAATVLIVVINRVEGDDDARLERNLEAAREQILPLITDPPPDDVDERLWAPVVDAANRVVVVPAVGASLDAAEVSATASAPWSYRLTWQTGDRSTSITVSEPVGDEQPVLDTVWAVGATSDQRALVIVEEPSCRTPSGETQRSIGLAVVDVLGDVVAQVDLGTGDEDPCSTAHALGGDALVTLMRDLMICRPQSNAFSGVTCTPLPLMDDAVAAGSALLVAP